MADFERLVSTCRNHRVFTRQEIDGDALKLIVRAALTSPTVNNLQSCHFIIIDENALIEQLVDCNGQDIQYMKGVPIAIVVCGKPEKDDYWIEDGAIASISMRYQADELGLASCWIQVRGRYLSDGTSVEYIVRGILGLPDEFHVLCIMVIGRSVEIIEVYDEECLKWENVHINKY